ncbi:hypothetical protein Prudu_002026 [Prunus dulcis]|uniref:Caffeoyl-CoA O-methyltransferase n=1 Tax=Prunus dulcis TaxID=3755 RepID=A0A4Y1QPT8_PRUDU|nr:hypothetical protein Prudu_002026 [Prunus dulcis]
MKSVMNVPVDESLLLLMLLKLMNANKTLEPVADLLRRKEITAIDPDKEAYEFGLPYIQKAGGKEEGSFDFAFVDANKAAYIKYHELLLKVVKVGGIIAYDNTLWFGTWQKLRRMWRNLQGKTESICCQSTAFLPPTWHQVNSCFHWRRTHPLQASLLG